MKTINRIHGWAIAAIFVGISTIVSGCSKEDDPKPTATVTGNVPIYYNTTERWISIQAIGDWKLSLTFEGGVTDWCSLARLSGTGNGFVPLKLTANEGDDPRTAKLTIQAQGTLSVTDIIQLDASQGDAENPPTPPSNGGSSATVVDKMKGDPKWLELPVLTTVYGESAVVNHGNTIGGKYVRNYTMLYDTTKYIAYWVAYPLSSANVATGGRTDAWAYDPKIPEAYQINVTKRSYPDKNDPLGTFDRGHQLPSADRSALSIENVQTFYVSNQTPQVSNLNQGLWGSLENRVRTIAGTVDTMYVVTGAYLGAGYKTTPDNSSPAKQIPVPTNYYKVLLSYKKSTSGTVTYKAIGFWFENRAYLKPDNVLSSKYAYSVTKIEEKTGLTFFPNLPDQSIKDTYNPQDWGL